MEARRTPDPKAAGSNPVDVEFLFVKDGVLRGWLAPRGLNSGKPKRMGFGEGPFGTRIRRGRAAATRAKGDVSIL